MTVKLIMLLMLFYESRGEPVAGSVYMRISCVAVKLDWSKAFPSSTQQGYSLYLAHNGNSGVHWTVHADQHTYLVTMLTDGSLYRGHVKPLNDDGPKRFQIITATMLQESELPSFLNEYSETESKNVTVSMASVTITLKLFGLGRRRAVLEITRANRPLQYIDLPMDARSVTVSGLEPNALLTLTLKHVLSTDPLKLKDLVSAHVYTGKVFPAGDNNHDANVSSTDLMKSYSYVNNRGDLLQKMVKCYLENEETFKGFPCSVSDVCIPLHWVCDGLRDCKEGDDERGCRQSLNQTGTSTLYFTGCTRNEFRCFSRGEFVCLPNSWLCDGHKDCSSGWDEDEDNCGGAINRPGTTYYQQHNYSNGCQNDFYKCSNGFGCIPDKFVCDGDSDCRDGSDEWDCPSVNYCDSRHEFQCFDSLTYETNRQCIPRSWMCDDQDDCPNGEDETSDICKPEADNFQWKT